MKVALGTVGHFGLAVPDPKKSVPVPETIDHVSFHLPDMDALRAALALLKERGVEVEDPGDEIGPEAKGSPNMGLWFHDPDGYRWELSVQAKR